MSYLLGIDLGTSSCKALLMDPSGRKISTGTAGYSIETPRPSWAEQDPAAWWSAVQCSVRCALKEGGVAPQDVAAIGLSGQMHGIVLLDERLRVLRPAIIWADGRSAAECGEMEQALGGPLLRDVACNKPSTGFSASKVLWVKEHEPRTFEQVRYILFPKDFVRLQMTGNIQSEPSDASGSLLFDVPHRRWSCEILASIGVDPGLLPEIVESTCVVGGLTQDAADALGLRLGTPVVAGAGDQAAAAVGNGLADGCETMVAIGTGGQIITCISSPVRDEHLRVHTLCHALPGKWYIMGAIQSAGLALDWFRKASGSTLSFGELCSEASTVGPGAQGLMFLPHLTGERSPYMDPMSRGAFVGLTLQHGRAHLVRAVLEGVTFALRQSLEIMQEIGIATREVIASASGGTNDTWRSILGDVLKVPTRVNGLEPASAYGAAFLAGLGVGYYSSFDDVRSIVRPKRSPRLLPDPANFEVYDRCFDLFCRLYPALYDINRGLSRLT